MNAIAETNYALVKVAVAQLPTDWLMPHRGYLLVETVQFRVIAPWGYVLIANSESKIIGSLNGVLLLAISDKF
jgi:hypothetical protein